MIRNLIIVFISAILIFACDYSLETSTVSESETVVLEVGEEVESPAYTSDEDMQYFSDAEISEEQVLIHGEVIKTLADDNEGSRHQKFLMRLESGQTLLISHNIDLADRINALEEGDEVTVFGQYEWNDRGGVIHWTHHDPDGYHVGGWIEHDNQRFE